jgi:hypothetical protein
MEVGLIIGGTCVLAALLWAAREASKRHTPDTRRQRTQPEAFIEDARYRALREIAETRRRAETAMWNTVRRSGGR